MRAAVVLGIGIGGFVDGVVVRQLLDRPQVLSGRYPAGDVGLMIGDGLFHLFWLVVVLAGVALLDRSAPLPRRVLLGGVLAGWGVFNLVEGVVDHHVRSTPGQLAYDLAFLASGAALLVAGPLFARRARG